MQTWTKVLKAHRVVESLNIYNSRKNNLLMKTMWYDRRLQKKVESRSCVKIFLFVSEQTTHWLLVRMKIPPLGFWVFVFVVVFSCLGCFPRSLVFSPCSIFQAMLDCHTKGSFFLQGTARDVKNKLHSSLHSVSWENFHPTIRKAT